MNRRTAAAPLLLALLALPGRPGSTLAQEVPPGTPAVTVPASVFVVAPGTLAREREANAVVRRVRAAMGGDGPLLYAPGAMVELALREAALRALDNNLGIRRSGLAQAIAERAVAEARAVFDPVFVATASANFSRTSYRVTTADRFKPDTEFVPVNAFDSRRKFYCSVSAAERTQLYEPTDLQASPAGGCYIIGFSTERAPVQTLQYDRRRPAGYYPSTVEGNDPSDFEPRHKSSYTGSLAILQQLPWGPSLNAQLQTTHQETYFPLNEVSALPPSYGAYGRPWVSSLTIGATVPLPFTKNFGPSTDADMAVRYRQLDVGVAGLDVRAVIETTLEQVETAYWTLVGSVQTLNVSEEAIANAEAMLVRMRRVVAEGLGTTGDLAQVEAQVARLRAVRDQRFARLLAASEQLRELMDSDRDAVFLPVGWLALLGRPVAVEHYHPERVRDNPTYERTAAGVRIARLGREQRRLQTRPDLSLTASLQYRQSNAVYGYGSAADSLTRLFSPDQTTKTLQLAMQYPWGNRAARGALALADATMRQQELLLEKVRLQLREEYETARVSIASARERIRMNERRAALAEDVHARSARLQETGFVGAYETLAKLSALIEARAAVIDARIAERLAETRMLSAIGALTERYGERTAQTDGDRERLALLVRSGQLRHFGGPL